jgi:hypothetical protein
MIQRLLARWRKPPLVSVTEFTDFLERNAWLVTQKSIIGYTTVKTRLPVHEMLREKQFSDAYAIAIWDSYVAVLADLMEIGLTYLRSADPKHGAIWAEALGDSYESLLEVHPLPAHRAGDSWASDVAALRQRLSKALDAPARRIREVSGQSAAYLFAKLPFHERLRRSDAPAVIANVEFLMVGLAHEFDRIDYGAITAEILSSRVLPANGPAA